MTFKITKSYAESEEAYKSFVILKANYYGEESESLIFALKNLAVVQSLLKKVPEAIQNSERAVVIINKLLDSGKMTDKIEFKKLAMEVIFMLISVYEGSKKLNSDSFTQEKSDEYERTFKRLVDGENTPQFAYFQFLKARQMMLNLEPNQELSLQAVQKAIDIQSEIEKDVT